jgi:predicted phosphoribosyltransferase
MGAIASGDVCVLNEEVIGWYGVPRPAIDDVVAGERRALEQREREYRGDRPPLVLRDRTVILVDDGLATGATMRAAVLAVREHRPRRVVVAVPVGAPSTCQEMAELADEMVSAWMPPLFTAVSQWYADFAQTSDDEVRRLLMEHARRATRVEKPA